MLLLLLLLLLMTGNQGVAIVSLLFPVHRHRTDGRASSNKSTGPCTHTNTHFRMLLLLLLCSC